MSLDINILLNFLTNRGWDIVDRNDKFHFLKPPLNFRFPDGFSLQIPLNEETVDYDRFLLNSIDIIAEVYELKLEDLTKIIEFESEIFSLRIIDENTADGSISFTRFEIMLEKVKSILVSTASFVISNDPLFAKSLNEAEMYLNHCTFLQTEKGSFISKVNLPTSQRLVEETLFGDQAIYAKDINNKIKNVIEYLNNEIFSEKDIVIDSAYIEQNKEFINIKLLRQFEDLYSKVEIKDVEFSFNSIESSQSFIVNGMNGHKLSRLNFFIKKVDEILNAEANMAVTGKVIALRSKNPDGTTNAVSISGITDERFPVVIIANLSSEDYKRAIEFHKEKSQVRISGLAKKEKTQFKFLRVDEFGTV